MNFLKNLKALMAMVAGGMVLGVVAALVVLAALVVFLIPGAILRQAVLFPSTGVPHRPSLPGDPTPLRFAHEGEGWHKPARRNTPGLGQTADAAPLLSPSMQFL